MVVLVYALMSARVVGVRLNLLGKYIRYFAKADEELLRLLFHQVLEPLDSLRIP